MSSKENHSIEPIENRPTGEPLEHSLITGSLGTPVPEEFRTTVNRAAEHDEAEAALGAEAAPSPQTPLAGAESAAAPASDSLDAAEDADAREAADALDNALDAPAAPESIEAAKPTAAPEAPEAAATLEKLEEAPQPSSEPNTKNAENAANETSIGEDAPAAKPSQKASLDAAFQAMDEAEARAKQLGTPDSVKKVKKRLHLFGRMLAGEPKSLAATKLAFFLTGFVMAVWASMVPFVKQSLELNEGEMGLLLLCVGLGALIGMPIAGTLTSRFGARIVLRWAVPITMAFCIMLSASSQTFVTAAFLLCFGFAFGVVDVAMSVHSVFVEKRLNRPVLSVIYAFYPIGGIAGALSMSLLLNLGLPIAPCVLALMTLSQLSWLGCGNWIVPIAGRAQGNASHFALPRGRVLLFGAVVFMVYLADGVILDWGGLLLTTVQGLAIENAGIGYACFSVAMTLMRLFGTKAVTVLGPRRTVVSGALTAAIAILVAVWIENPWVTAAMFFLVGLGVSSITPITFSEAGRTKDMSMSAALSAVSTLGYSGVLLGPALIGAIAHATSLPIAFCTAAILLVLTAFAGIFYPKTDDSAASAQS